MSYQNLQPLIEVTRGQTVESVHFGALAVVDSGGNLLAGCGGVDFTAYLRSAAKPFQALPLVESGGADAFGFDEGEIAITCASHSGSDEHVAVVTTMQKKIGVDESHLLCGSHPPMFHEPTRQALIRRGEEVEVPAFVVEVLKNAIKEIYAQDDVTRSIVMREVPAYPFSAAA